MICGRTAKSMPQICARLNRFAEDWESSEMRIYDDYDTAKSNLQKG